MSTDPKAWRKSSYSETMNCLEVRLTAAADGWFKSSRSSDSFNCVEVHRGPLGVQLRDSKLGDASPILTFTEDEWREFLERVKSS